MGVGEARLGYIRYYYINYTTPYPFLLACKQDLPPLPHAFPILSSLKKLSIDLHLVTSRQHIIEDDTVRWIDRYYPGKCDV